MKLFRKLKNKVFREAFMSARVAAAVGGQIANIREKRGWTQGKLARRARMKQSRISLLEKADYESFSFTTLKRIAAAFDLAVIIQFVSFRDFLRWSESFDEKVLIPESFTESEEALKEEQFAAFRQIVSQLAGTPGGALNSVKSEKPFESYLNQKVQNPNPHLN
jgi:transcriptional regulator with XRE-family HTH domain